MNERLLGPLHPSVNSVEVLDNSLLVAATYGDAAQVEELIQRGADVNTVNDKEQTPLMLAASRPTGDLHAMEICKVLLDQEADVDARDHRRESALHKACERGNMDVIKVLLQNDPDLDLRNTQGHTAIQKPLMRGQHKVAKVLIAAGADLWTMNKTGKSLMQHLCANGGQSFSELDKETQTQLLIKDCLQDSPEIEAIIFHRLFPTLKLNLLEYILRSTEQNPLECMLTVAVAMQRRARKSFMIRQELEELSDYFIGLANSCLEVLLRKDHKLALKVVGLKDFSLGQRVPALDAGKLFIYHDGNIFEQGPIMVAIEHDLGEFFVCPVVQEAIRQVWKGVLDAYDLSKCSFLLVKQTNWECPLTFQLYRQVPLLFTCVELIFYVVTLGLTLYIILSPWHFTCFAQEELVLLLIMCGYAANEAIQLFSWGFAEYISNAWTLMDLVVLGVFTGWFVLKLCGEGYAEVGYRLLTSNAFFMVFRLLHYVSMAEMFGIMVMAMMSMFKDIVRFLLLYAVVLLSFTAIVQAQFSSLDSFSSPEKTALQLFSVSVGCYFDFSVFEGDEYEGTGCIIIVLFMVLASVMLLNLLIAVLCDAYYNISNHKTKEWCLMRAKFISERTMVVYFPPPFNILDLLIFLLSKLFHRCPTPLASFFDSTARLLIFLCDVFITTFLVLPVLSLLDSLIVCLPFKFSITLSEIFESYIFVPWLTWPQKLSNVFKFVLLRPIFYYSFTLCQCFKKIPWILRQHAAKILDDQCNGMREDLEKEEAQKKEWRELYLSIQEEVLGLSANDEGTENTQTDECDREITSSLVIINQRMEALERKMDKVINNVVK